MSIGNLPESLSQAILVGTSLVGRLGVSNEPLRSHRGPHRRDARAPHVQHVNVASCCVAPRGAELCAASNHCMSLRAPRQAYDDPRDMMAVTSGITHKGEAQSSQVGSHDLNINNIKVRG